MTAHVIVIAREAPSSLLLRASKSVLAHPRHILPPLHTLDILSIVILFVIVILHSLLIMTLIVGVNFVVLLDIDYVHIGIGRGFRVVCSVHVALLRIEIHVVVIRVALRVRVVKRCREILVCSSTSTVQVLGGCLLMIIQICWIVIWGY
jgi:hypothetical protein